MKKIIFLLSCAVLSISCSKNESDSLSAKPAEANYTVTYTYGSEKFSVNIIKSKDTVLMVENEESQRIEDIYNSNPTLIEYSISENELILFKNDVEFNKFLESNNKLSKKGNLSSRSTNWTNDNLQLYGSKYFHDQFPWITQDPCAVFNEESSDDEIVINRLKYMGTDSYWDYAPRPPYDYCMNSQFPGELYTHTTNGNDIISSVMVYDLMVRFYEHHNYGGKSFVIDATNGQALGISNLSTKKLSLFHSWNDKITSIKIY